MKTKSRKELEFKYKDKEDIESLLIKTFKGKDDRKYYKVVHPIAKTVVSLVLISHDLQKAIDSVAKALSLKKKVDDIDDLIISALWIQAIMLYTKSFTASDDGFTKLEVKDYIKSKKDKALHAQLMTLRNSFLAHRGRNDFEHGVLLLTTKKVENGYMNEYHAPAAHSTGNYVKPAKSMQNYLIKLQTRVKLKADIKITKLDEIFLEVLRKPAKS